ncbi:SNF2 family N-terminal domain-containing protein, partial [Piptocephalis cylindrospora]
IQLKEYQKRGIRWMKTLYDQDVGGGILADEMGLGKTAQVIAFISTLLIRDPGARPHLIVVPTSTVGNWEREFTKFCPSLSVLVYHGSQGERAEIRDHLHYQGHPYDVLLTTYPTATGSAEDRSFLKKRRFKCIILDEGHMMKNFLSIRYKSLMAYKGNFRLLLTGTPLQNNLQELCALLAFVVPSVFGRAKESLIKAFRGRVDLTVKSGSGSSTKGVGILSQERIDRAKRMMAPFVLRRRKCQVLQELPVKTVEVRKCIMSSHQAQVYEEVKETSVVKLWEEGMGIEKSKEESEEEKEKAKEDKVRTKVPNVLMELRKAACHPLLLRSIYDDARIEQMAREILREDDFTHSEYPYVLEDMEAMSDFQLHQLCCRYRSIQPFKLLERDWMSSAKVTALRELLVKDTEDRFLLFSQFTMMLDILENVMKSLDVPYLRMDGQTKSTDRTGLIDQFNASDSPYQVFLLSTKAGGFGINLTSANTVILHDMDFNPHNDRQAEDRAHRVGQIRPVKVVKLVSQGTIEEDIYTMAEAKLRLDRHVS